MSAKIEETRVNPVRRSQGPRAGLPGTAGALGLVAAMGLAAAGALYWTFREAPALPRPKAEFAPPPQLATALAAAQAKLKENPQDIAALVQAGLLHFQQGKESYLDAINELEEARELGALDSRIFYCLGIMYQQEGLYSFAAEEYKRFLRNHPDDKETRMSLAKLLYQQGSFPEAVGEYERLKFQSPDDSLVEENLGLSLWGAKLVERAEESFRRLKTMGPLQAKRAELYLGQIDLALGRDPSAVEHILASLPSSDSEDIGIPRDKVYSALAMAYQKLGRSEEARSAWQKALDYAPGDPKAKAALRELSRRAPPKKRKNPAQKP